MFKQLYGNLSGYLDDLQLGHLYFVGLLPCGGLENGASLHATLEQKDV